MGEPALPSIAGLGLESVEEIDDIIEPVAGAGADAASGNGVPLTQKTRFANRPAVNGFGSNWSTGSSTRRWIKALSNLRTSWRNRVISASLICAKSR